MKKARVTGGSLRTLVPAVGAWLGRWGVRGKALVRGAASLGLVLGVSVAQAQGSSQVQYLYDAAGNVIQITRSAATPKPDLTVSNLSVGVIWRDANGAYNLPVSFRVNNVGTAAAVATWYDRGYLSVDAALQNSDQVLGGATARSTDLAPGASYTVTTTLVTSTSTAAGDYTLIVKADGGANTSGQYSIIGANYVAEGDESNNTQSVTVSLLANPKPDFTLTNLAVGTITTNQNGSYAIPLTFQVNNVGQATASAPWYDRAYLSADAVLNDTDQVLAGNNYRGTALTPGSSYNVSMTVTTTATTAPGTYSLIAKADGGNSASGQYSPTGTNYVAETDETNNTQAAAIVLPTLPDLVISNLTLGAVQSRAAGGYDIPLTFTVTNSGGSTAKAPWYDRAYLSTDGALDNADQVLSGNNYRGTDLAVGASYTVTMTFTTTTATLPGAYTVFARTDGGNSTGQYSPTGPNYLTEIDEANNAQGVAIVLPTLPDLVISNLTLGASRTRSGGGYEIPLTFTVTNSGGSAARSPWYDRAYLSTDGTLDNADQVLSSNNYRGTDLAVGASYPVTMTFTTSATTPPGTYTVFAKTDGGSSTSGQYSPTGPNYLTETDETNNTTSASVTLNADLVISNLVVGTITTRTGGGYNIPVTFTVTNAGSTPAAAGWYDRGYLSSDALLQDTDQVLGSSNYRSSDLAAGGSYTASVTFTTSTTTVAGTYTLLVKADGGSSASGQYAPTGANYVPETSESNNIASATVVLP